MNGNGSPGKLHKFIARQLTTIGIVNSKQKADRITTILLLCVAGILFVGAAWLLFGGGSSDVRPPVYQPPDLLP